MVKLVLCDLRETSPSAGNIKEIFFGEDNHCMVHIPPGIANGSKGMTDPFALICNVASEPHNPELKYLSPISLKIVTTFPELIFSNNFGKGFEFSLCK